MITIPKKLSVGDEIRIVSPATSLAVISAEVRRIALANNEGYTVINEGHCEGSILGGNLCTLNLLQGTEYMPSIANSILLIEDDSESQPLTFDRDLQSLIHQPEVSQVKGVIIGRFQRASNMSREQLEKVIRSKRELNDIPVIINADFGHTTPQFTFPIGGRARVVAKNGRVAFSILEH